ncbi:hypothetical protein GRAN_1714 [Granulicella sibirica]|uniref:Uncharacterized protein n=1 Tax=Granulicella sibirica TaxID=2479048 RepID=A0A4V1L687_9BACT|nr:hypothetical protein GRAN_1714 [Granulicella sibirica]
MLHDPEEPEIAPEVTEIVFAAKSDVPVRVTIWLSSVSIEICT